MKKRKASGIENKNEIIFEIKPVLLANKKITTGTKINNNAISKS